MPTVINVLEGWERAKDGDLAFLQASCEKEAESGTDGAVRVVAVGKGGHLWIWRILVEGEIDSICFVGCCWKLKTR